MWGLLITLVTWLLLPSGTILFGILHLIGVSAVLAYPFIKHRWLALWSGIVCLLLGFVVAPLSAPTWWLLPLGIEPLGFFSIDYYPILPWFGFVLIGIFFANTVYTNRKATVHPCAMSARSASWIGKHSLAIYLLHQPILFGSIFVATKLL